MHGRRHYRDASAAGTIINEVVVEVTGPGCCLRLGRDTLFQFSRFFVHETEQDVFSPHRLSHVANTRALLLHPGVDYRFQCRCTISAHSTVKALKPVHTLSLSTQEHRLPVL